MKRHIDAPAAWLLTTGGCGGVGALCCQCGEMVPAALLGLVATVALVVGAVKTRVFYR